MSSKNKRTVYSTDPEPEEAVAEQKPVAGMNPAGPFAAQGDEPVRVHRDKKGRRGKTVSIIKGVKSPTAGKQALLKHLKSKLGTGGTIRDGDIEIQGENRDRIVLLLNELGFKAKSAGG